MSAVRRYAPWAALALVAVVVAALLTTPRSGEPLHPSNPGPQGAQALYEVLRSQGVDVEVVNGTSEIDPADVGPGTSVLLAHTAYLGPESGPDLLADLAGLDRLVVLVDDPQRDVGAVLGLDLDASSGSGLAVSPDCTDPVVREGDRVVGWDVLLSAGGEDRARTTACYPPGAGHNAGGAREGALLVLEAEQDRPLTVVAGVGPTWTNAQITEEANAALALRTLGASDRLLWVVPQPGDAGLDAASSLWDVLPRNLTAAIWVVAGGVLALALWQGRRLGAVVTEPLPAVVRATETTLSRGRLYHQAHDRQHAARTVQAGARRRLARVLGVPTGTGDPAALVAAVSGASHGDDAQVRRLLVDSDALPDDDSLVHLVREIHDLEEQVRHPVDRSVPTTGPAGGPTPVPRTTPERTP
ncbi:Putative secreted protein [Serinicoccus hydrothermalis]|uniref:Secreted protein n=1 Tax=Serinicoccus hydrothermalis TaxID=1758689 RepID=A0A1B1NGF7_9MICO|nr:DUF4350 domain-containing protein [Serinicoccus hydrothermalis]ANS80504.1 Putative secreted protein [Serinicoccus hydrothermalis]